MYLQFSIVRLLLVMAVFAIAFGVTKSLEYVWMPTALLWAILLAGIVLLAEQRSVQRIFHVSVCCVIGAVYGSMSCPTLRPPYEPGDELFWAICGAFAGWVVSFGVDSGDSYNNVRRRPAAAPNPGSAAALEMGCQPRRSW